MTGPIAVPLLGGGLVLVVIAIVILIGSRF
jgi:hypothetical protein